jgi:hypothetical protein
MDVRWTGLRGGASNPGPSLTPCLRHPEIQRRSSGGCDRIGHPPQEVSGSNPDAPTAHPVFISLLLMANAPLPMTVKG